MSYFIFANIVFRFQYKFNAHTAYHLTDLPGAIYMCVCVFCLHVVPIVNF